MPMVGYHDKPPTVIDFTRTLRTSGDSYVVTIPPEVVARLGWDEQDDLAIGLARDGESIVIRRSEDDDEERSVGVVVNA